MGKISDRYFKVAPWEIIEEGFDPDRGRVSESIFSLGNEYMGVRGYFEEGYSGDKLVGSYFNGLYEETEVKHPARYKGFVDKSRDLTNSVDWLYIRINLDGESLDLKSSEISEFKRILDMKKGLLKREFIWKTASGKQLKLYFERFLSMIHHNLGCQRIIFEPLDFSGEVEIITGLDFTHHAAWQDDSNWECIRKEKRDDIYAILGRTKVSKLHLFSSFRFEVEGMKDSVLLEDDRFLGTKFKLVLIKGNKTVFTKMAVNLAYKNKENDPNLLWVKGMDLARRHNNEKYENALDEHLSYWDYVWKNLDVSITGDDENQQGIRFCIYQLHQTYHGGDSSLNIGAKGLSGEAYGGKVFWDTEAYCLQFYIFNNPKAARNLLEYRYNMLPKAIERARELDCRGACYPISSIDGEEGCGAWQHSSLQIHVSGSIAYGIQLYTELTQDRGFLYNQGIEMLIEICRFYESRVQQDPVSGQYGFYGVMGVDEFHMMVNNNCFLNYMVKKCIEFTLSTINEMNSAYPAKLLEAEAKTGLTADELIKWKVMSENMYIPQDKHNGLFEQHNGYFRLPHLDIHSIPVTDFPLYNNWSYDRIYRTDMIKQPDVLMMLFLYNRDFDLDIKRVNYEYYEPRCIHESSLSPSVHSILAAEIGKKEEAYEFFKFAIRLDLDDYNRNTNEGLHITSIAAAWMNIVYGYGGLRNGGGKLIMNPTIPETWQSYSFNLLYRGSVLSFNITREKVDIAVKGNVPVELIVYGKSYLINTNDDMLTIPINDCTTNQL